MANEKNLKPFPKNPRTSEEQVRLARKAGIASGVARRKKCASRKFMKEVLSLPAKNTPRIKKMLAEFGADPDYPLTVDEVGTLSILYKYSMGDTRVYDQVHEYLAEDPHTMLEEKRIKAQQAAIESLKNSDGFMQAMGGVVEEVFDDGGDTPDTLEDTD